MYDEGMSTAIDDINLTLKPAAECCSLTGGLLDAEQAERVAGMLKALADPTRWRLLSHLNAQGCLEVCACDLTDYLSITQPTVSPHMKKHIDAGLTPRAQRGRWPHYSIVPEAFTQPRHLHHLTYAGGIGRAQQSYPRGDQSHRRYCH